MFFIEIKTFSLDKQSNPLDNNNLNYIMFTFSLHHVINITIYWEKQPISFDSAPFSKDLYTGSK